MEVYRDAIRHIVGYFAAQTPLTTDRDKYSLLKDGVQVSTMTWVN